MDTPLPFLRYRVPQPADSGNGRQKPVDRSGSAKHSQQAEERDFPIRVVYGVPDAPSSMLPTNPRQQRPAP